MLDSGAAQAESTVYIGLPTVVSAKVVWEDVGGTCLRMDASWLQIHAPALTWE